MKKILTFFCLLLLPAISFADVQFFLSPQGEPYDPDVWTSQGYPDLQSGMMYIEFTPSVMPIAQEYIVVDSVVKELFQTITSQTGSVEYDTQEIEQFEIEEYETLIATENPSFIEHITTAINPETETIIQEKIDQNIVLTPFEELFYNCEISLEERQAIVLDVLDRIGSGEIENLENISYSNPSFGDCIIPFPDVSHRETVVENSFASNQLLAQTLLQEETQYQTHETIENIVRQESSFQEDIIQSEVHHTGLLETGIITQSQYNITQDIPGKYQKILTQTDISYELQTSLLQEFEFFNKMNNDFLKLLKTELISSEEYDNLVQDIEKASQLQQYFFGLLQSGDITMSEYQQYIQESQSYLQNTKDIIEQYQRQEITEKEYRKNIKEIQKQFHTRYLMFYDFFTINTDTNNTEKTEYMRIIILSMGLIFMVGIVSIGITRYKKRLGKK